MGPCKWAWVLQWGGEWKWATWWMLTGWKNPTPGVSLTSEHRPRVGYIERYRLTLDTDAYPSPRGAWGAMSFRKHSHQAPESQPIFSSWMLEGWKKPTWGVTVTSEQRSHVENVKLCRFTGDLAPSPFGVA